MMPWMVKGEPMKRIGIGLALLATLLFGGVTAAMAADGGGDASSVAAPQVQELQKQMLGDPGIMALILALQNDPEMQTLLYDPKIVAAVQAGDIGVLLADPRFTKLLDNPRVREIGERLGTPKTDK
jgi:hypothetical protein